MTRGPRRGTAALGLTLVLAGCGGGAHEARPPAPQLPRDLAQRLAQNATAVASSLDAGDACGASEQAAALRREVDAAIGRGQVPVSLRVKLSSGLGDLLERMPACTPASPPPTEAPGPPGLARGHGHGKGHEKKHGKGGDED